MGATAILVADNRLEGEQRMVLYRMPWDVEVITTNGLPMWENMSDEEANARVGRLMEELDPFAGRFEAVRRRYVELIA